MTDLNVQADAGRPAGLGGTWDVSKGGNAKDANQHSEPGVDGEALRTVGALSAPPPGFNAGSADNSRSSIQANLWSQENAIKSEDRTNSFTNLANALGSGLADSIDDATKGDRAILTDSFLNPSSTTDLSYARHTRHAASRIIGGQSKDPFAQSHKNATTGSLFGGSFPTGERTAVRKSNSGDQPALFGGYESKADHKPPASSLSPGFSNEFPDRSGYRPSFQSASSSSSYDGGSSRLTATKDLGLTVMEPADSYGRGGSRSPVNTGNRQDRVPYDLQRGMQNMWSDRGGEIPQQRGPRDTNGGSGASSIEALMETEESLRPFTWDVRHHETSRALAIMRTSGLVAGEVRSVCESYGLVENFRADFVDRGVFFVSYFDMRCAQYAAMDLKTRLQKLGPIADNVLVQFCVPLNSSSQNDESLVVLMDIPMNMSVDSLAAMMSSYGAVRSLKNMGGSFGGNSYVVEYHDVQDAKQAVLELESTQPWGPNVSVETGTRNPPERKKGRELLALIGRWRHGAAGTGPTTRPVGDGQSSQFHPERHDTRYERGGPPETQLVLGPDGRYTYVVVNQSHGHPVFPAGRGSQGNYHDTAFQTGPGGYVTHVNHAGYYAPQTHHFSSGGSVVSQSSHQESHGHYPSGSRSLPYYPEGSGSVGSRGSHMMSLPHPSSASAGGERDNSHLVLDLDAVENGRDARTSLMVRNIPNKYTQQMLLSEFGENGHGPGVIDFFYLPIDFKNRCNRGYAFINFVDFRDILPFHRRYYGKHWRTFNSDKICDITYARIQGKSAMLKRFENSALMEKDDEYKPLVFVSSGADRGKRLPFPVPPNK